MELSDSKIKKFHIFPEMEPLTLSRLKKLKKSTPKKFLIFSQKKAVLVFREKETLKKLLILQEMETLKSFLYFRKRNFLIFRERHIQNPDIFRTLVYLEPKAYSENYQTSTTERFAKIATWRTFLYSRK